MERRVERKLIYIGKKGGKKTDFYRKEDRKETAFYLKVGWGEEKTVFIERRIERKPFLIRKEGERKLFFFIGKEDGKKHVFDR